MNYVLGGVLLAIVGVLLSAGVFLVRDHGKSDRVRRALTLRVALSVGLFLFIMLGVWLGWFTPHGPLAPG